MRALTAPLAAAFSASVLAFAPGAQEACASGIAFPDPEDPPASFGVPSLWIQLDALRTTYKRGEKAQLKADVRIGTLDGPKAVDARVKVLIRQKGKTLVELFGETDSGGAAMIRFTVPRFWPTGTVTADASAKQELVPGYDCRAPLIYQGGNRSFDPLFKVKG